MFKSEEQQLDKQTMSYKKKTTLKNEVKLH